MDRRPEPQRRTMTLWEQMSTPDTAIRDFLKVPHEDRVGGDADRRPCTLMDAICRDSRGDGGAGMIKWKPLRDRLRFHRPASTSSTTTSNRRAGEDVSEDEGEESKDEAPAVASMSLLAMLEQADNRWDDDGDDEEDSRASASSSGTVVGEEQEDGEGMEEGMVRPCCVCMVRHKGAAFIPCGHTFCRLCSRELWHTGASCPLCNAFIHDILHIF